MYISRHRRRYRELANELRLLVFKMKHTEAAEELRLLAARYERLAEHAEERATGARTITTSSPLGSALIGASAGQEVAYQADMQADDVGSIAFPFAHIAGPELGPGADRLRGYKDALKEVGISPPQEFVISNPRVEEIGEDVGREAMRTLLKVRPRPDAVFCYNDHASRRCLQGDRAFTDRIDAL